MSEQNVSERIEKVDVSFPFTPELNQMYDTQPIYRILIDVSESSAMGFLQLGYYIKLNESVYFVRKKAIYVFTNSQVERVFEYLKRTKREFTVDVRRDRTVSGHQHVELSGVDIGNGVYTLSDYRVFNSLWQQIEFELYENTYSPSMARFTGERLIWYTKLLPEHSIAFTQVAKINLEYVGKQGHLEVYKIITDGQFIIPNYLYSVREGLRFFNHEIKTKLYVIPLGSERRIIDLAKDTQVVSNDHEPITLETGQYLLFHPRPQQNRVD